MLRDCALFRALVGLHLLTQVYGSRRGDMGQASAGGQQRASQSRLRSAGGAQVAGRADLAPAPPAAPAAAHPCSGDPAAPEAAPCGAGGLADAPAQHSAARQPGLGMASLSPACIFHAVYPKSACPRPCEKNRAGLRQRSPSRSSTVPAHNIANGCGGSPWLLIGAAEDISGEPFAAH